ncbi:MAG: macro domain-containing protein [Candidatus Manganitrophus sp.]|nr:macro domain-containing protein [Candidatus Manganitrophus sp.]WDT70202.1 MAG: macro domain-containing protein [Candidatus Manganitrophus sp.]WDT78146.1 MAG: macro domain-containing protein [Candidatus Manganitrophus sp.]
MIELKQGDILQADAQVLVNTVNCIGIMGRGIALQFRKAFPENYKAYKAICDRKQLLPGKMLVHDLNRFENPRYIINFPTKLHWKGKSRIEHIESGLKALVEEVRHLEIKSIAVPPLGCGLGGLHWNKVRPMIEEAFRNLPEVHVLLYEPTGTPDAEKMVKQKQAPRMTVGRASLLGLMRRYLSAVMDPSVTLLEIHKLMYFMQEAGEGLKLKYKKGTFGPYSENLRHVLSLIEGHFISGYGDATDRPDKQIELKLGISDKAEEFLKNYPETHERFDRVVALIKGFETSFGMELLSTVHWVVTREGASTVDKAIAKTYKWNDRKRMFTEEQIRSAWDVLSRKGWLREESV